MLFCLFPSSSVSGQITTEDFSDLDTWEIWGEFWGDAWFDGNPINGTIKPFESDYQLVNEELYVGERIINNIITI